MLYETEVHTCCQARHQAEDGLAPGRLLRTAIYTRRNPRFPLCPSYFPSFPYVIYSVLLVEIRSTTFKHFSTTTMSTFTNARPSAIPRPARAVTPAMVGPRPTKASLLRAGQIKEGNAAGQRKAAVIQHKPEIKMAMIPVNSTIGRIPGGILKKKNEGNGVGNRGGVMKGVAAPMARSVVSSNTPRVKKADSRFAAKKKMVHFDEVVFVRWLDLEAGERFPWLEEDPKPYELFEGELD